jgi:uncharacterized protein YyaL (SSP411 family)
VYRTTAELAAEFSLDAQEIKQAVHRVSVKLLELRTQRIPPGRDDKILTAWNGLMIRGMAIAARHLDEPAWAGSAERALDFIRNTLWQDGRLLATCKDGRAHLNAYLDDYVYLIDGILELLQVRWRDGDLDFAIELAEVVLQHFADETGGFFFTSDDHEALIQRPKPNHDDATPSGNGIAAKVFGRLGHLLGESRYLEVAENTLKSIWSGIESMPHGHASLLVALEETLYPGQTVIIRGTEPAIRDWQKQAAQPYAPRRFTLTIPATAVQLPGQLSAREVHGNAVAYLCKGNTCGAPLTDRETFITSLTET